jgi:class 3 adenylate cyclase
MRFVSKDLTVAFIDQVGYTKLAMSLEKEWGAKGIGELNGEIQAQIDAAIAFVGLSRVDCVVGTTGDGALLRFECADDAVVAAAALHTSSAMKASQEALSDRDWLFRVGIGTGEVAIDTDATEGNGLAGTAIIRAARLEQFAKPGGTLIDVETWNGCSERQRVHFVGPEVVVAKHNHEIHGFRSFPRHVLSQPEATSGGIAMPSDRQSLMKLALTFMKKIIRSWQIDIIWLKLGAPMQDAPSANKTVRERYIDILSWADSHNKIIELISIMNSVTMEEL